MRILPDLSPIALRFWAITLAIFSLVLVSMRSASAEFIQTMRAGVYHTIDGKTVVLTAFNDGAQGLFIAHFKTGIPPQEFNPEKLPLEGAAHIFVKFDPTAENPYSDIIVGSKSYKVVGNLNIQLGTGDAVSVNIDNSNPYITVSQSNGSHRDDSLLGFYGLTEIVKGTGNLAAILAANQLTPDISKIIKPYKLEEDRLTLNNKDVEKPTIGVFIKRDHKCVASTTAILTLAQLKQIQKAKGEIAQAQLLDKALKDNSNKSRIMSHLVLRSDPKSPMILLNISDKNVYDLRAIKNSFSSKTICVFSPIS